MDWGIRVRRDACGDNHSSETLSNSFPYKGIPSEYIFVRRSWKGNRLVMIYEFICSRFNHFHMHVLLPRVLPGRVQTDAQGQLSCWVKTFWTPHARFSFWCLSWGPTNSEETYFIQFYSLADFQPSPFTGFRRLLLYHYVVYSCLAWIYSVQSYAIVLNWNIFRLILSIDKNIFWNNHDENSNFSLPFQTGSSAGSAGSSGLEHGELDILFFKLYQPGKLDIFFVLSQNFVFIL